MKARLKRNICQLDGYSSLSEVEDLDSHKAVYIGDTLEYACQFWTKHLVRTISSKDDVDDVHGEINQFFTTYLLFWIEVLSLTGHLDAGIYAMNDIEEWYMVVSFV